MNSNPIEQPGPGIVTPDPQPEPLPDVVPQPGRPVPQITNPIEPEPGLPSEPSGPGPVVQPGTTVLPIR